MIISIRINNNHFRVDSRYYIYQCTLAIAQRMHAYNVLLHYIQRKYHFIHVIVNSGIRLKVGISVDIHLFRVNESCISINQIFKLIYHIALVVNHRDILNFHSPDISLKEYIYVYFAMQSSQHA